MDSFDDDRGLDSGQSFENVEEEEEENVDCKFLVGFFVSVKRVGR